MDFEEVADQLYALPLEEFVAERNAAAKRAKNPQLKTLAKPTRSAWEVNRLVREEKSLMKELFHLGEELRQAQRNLDGSRLRELVPRQRELLHRLKQASGSLTPALQQEVLSTLNAALADEQAAAQVKAGRLTQALSHTGFAELTVAPAAAARERERKSERNHAKRRAREAAAQALHQAEQEVERCRQAQLQAQHALEQAEAAREAARARLGEL